MDYGSVGVCASNATGDGAGAGGVTFAGIVRLIVLPLSSSLLTDAGVAAGLSIYGPPAVAATLAGGISPPNSIVGKVG